MEENGQNRQNDENAVGSAAETQKKKTLVLRAVCLIVALLFAVAAFFIGLTVGRGETDAQERSLLWMIDAVEKNYRGEVTRDELFDRLYDALELDRFCTHYTPEEYREMLSESRGENNGYGFSVSAEGGAVRVSRVIQNSPAALAGIAKGMYIYACGDGTAAADTATVSGYLSSVQGGAELSCGYAADGSDARTFALTAGDYLASYCIYADSGATFCFRGEESLELTETGAGIGGLAADTAYIALIQFEGNADREFGRCLAQMKERGRKHLVIDLRGNGGGYLSVLCGIASHLLRNAEGDAPLIAEARFRDGRKQDYTAYGNDFSDCFSADAHISVLADENSASASEALIGALVSYGTCGYGDIYLRKGEGVARTYGKGVMQSRFVAPDENAMRLTVADIYWPNGNYIHGRGITEEDGAVPVTAPLLPAAHDEFLERTLALVG